MSFFLNMSVMIIKVNLSIMKTRTWIHTKAKMREGQLYAQNIVPLALPFEHTVKPRPVRILEQSCWELSGTSLTTGRQQPKKAAWHHYFQRSCASAITAAPAADSSIQRLRAKWKAWGVGLTGRSSPVSFSVSLPQPIACSEFKVKGHQP